MKVFLKAYCKINLFLNVSYFKHEVFKKHKLESVCLKYHELYDEVYISKNNTLMINYFKDNEEIRFENDLIKKSLLWLKNRFNLIDINYQILVIKKIPIGSGLGGESSDVATILNFICKQNRIILNTKDYLDIALELGSDICFFLFDYDLAYVTDYGNIVKPLLNIKIKYELLLNPNVNSSTKKVFSVFDTLVNNFEGFLGYEQIVYILQNKKYHYLFNNLKKAIFLCYQELKIIYDNLMLTYKNDYVLLSGSGSSIVVIKKDE